MILLFKSLFIFSRLFVYEIMMLLLIESIKKLLRILNDLLWEEIHFNTRVTPRVTDTKP